MTPGKQLSRSVGWEAPLPWIPPPAAQLAKDLGPASTWCAMSSITAVTCRVSIGIDSRALHRACTHRRVFRFFSIFPESLLLPD